jgi:hypothetical protein
MTDDTRFQRNDVESNVPSLSLNIRVKSNEAIQNVLLTVHVNSPLYAQPNEIRMNHIGGSYLNIKSFAKISIDVRYSCDWYRDNCILDAR